MSKSRKPDLSNIRELRRKLGMNQAAFWNRYGITQSGGSRYESGRKIPLAALILIHLRETEQISENQLLAANKVVSKARTDD